MFRGERRDLTGRPPGVAQVEGETAGGLKILKGLLLVGADHGLGAEPRGRLDEVVRAVGGRREQKQNARRPAPAHILSSIDR